MNYKEILEKLEVFRELLERYDKTKFSSDEEKKTLSKDICVRYGELEDLIERFTGRQAIPVEIHGRVQPVVCANYIEAGYLSGRTFYAHQGYIQLLKIIGKVQQLAKDPLLPHDEYSVSRVIQILGRFRECCQYLKEAPDNEKDVQDIVWIMLRSHFDRLEREENLPRFGVKSYKPDFGIPELGVLIEIKYIGDKTQPADIQEKILADIPGYLTDQSRYNGIIVLTYDGAHKLRDSTKFIEDIRSAEGIIDVVVVPGVG